MADKIYRRVGDYGSGAAIKATLKDADDAAITAGTTTLRIASQDGATNHGDFSMTHDGSGVWSWTPTSGQLPSSAGTYRMTVETSNVTLPAREDVLLVMRGELPAPA